MAHGKSIEQFKWYVKNPLTRTAECGPYTDAEIAQIALEKRKAQLGDDAPELYLDRVNVAKLRPYRRYLTATIENGKHIPAKSTKR